MSSISFPSAQDHSQNGSSSHHRDDSSQFYSSTFDTSASFQINPLSSHPPRTPRASVISDSSQVYGSSIYETKEEAEVQDAVEEEEIDEEEGRVKVAEGKLRKEEVWREIFLTSYGRDKGLKIIQYSIRVFLLFHAQIAASRLWQKAKRSETGIEFLKRLASTASGLSTARKTLLLFNWLQPLTAIMAQQSVPFSAEQSKEASKKTQRPFLHTVLYAPPPVLLELVNAVADDIATWSKLGLLGRRVGERAARFSDWCWFLSTLVGLVENGVERQMITSLQHEVEGRLYNESMTGATAKSKPKSTKLDEKELMRLQKQDYWLQVSRAKLAMDLIHVSYDLFHIKRAKDGVKAFTGLLAAILSSAKVYNRHKTSLLKSVLSG